MLPPANMRQKLKTVSKISAGGWLPNPAGVRDSQGEGVMGVQPTAVCQRLSARCERHCCSWAS